MDMRDTDFRSVFDHIVQYSLHTQYDFWQSLQHH